MQSSVHTDFINSYTRTKRGAWPILGSFLTLLTTKVILAEYQYTKGGEILQFLGNGSCIACSRWGLERSVRAAGHYIAGLVATQFVYMSIFYSLMVRVTGWDRVGTGDRV